MFDPSAIQMYRKDQDNLVAHYRGVLLQIRNGKMTPEIVGSIVSIVQLLSAQFFNQNIAALMVIEDSAEVPDAATRAAQTQAFKAHFRTPRTFVAYCVIGSGPKAMLLRAFGRLLAAGQPRFNVFDDPKPAAKWISEKIGRLPSAMDIETATDWARREARAIGAPASKRG